MKKSIRFFASLLTILALLVSLPIGAMAADNTSNKPLNTEPIDTNSATITTNIGSVETNKGTVTNNGGETGAISGTVETNDGTVTNNGVLGTGTVGTNNGTVTNNGVLGTGTIGTNNGTVETNGTRGTVDANNKDVNNNDGTVTNNNSQGTVKENNGTVGTNNGTVETNSKTGTVETNNGTVVENQARGVIDVNRGNVGTTAGGGNAGTIHENYGEVNMNKDRGKIGFNGEGGTVAENQFFGKIYFNMGTVEQNDGEVITNGAVGEVLENNGFVGENFGQVTNTQNGVVIRNEGTVENEEGGTLYEYGWSNSEDDETKNVITAAGTYHGVLVEKNAEAPETEETGLLAVVKQVLHGESLNLKNLFTKDGYEYAGYQVLNEEDEYVTYEGDEYIVEAPNALQLLWRKIKLAVAPSPKPASPEAEPVAKKVVSTYIPTEIKVGTEIRVKNQRFKIVEMEDGSYLIATIGKLSEKDLADMMAFLARYFTPEQLAKLTGEPELLSDELVAKSFGGDLAHIAFRVSKDIFKK